MSGEEIPVADSTTQFTGVQVQLSVRRGRDAIAFYREAFGAVEVFRFESEDGAEIVAQLAIGGTLFWLEDESPEHGNYSPETLGGATERLLLLAGDPVAAVDRAIKAGARAVYPVEQAHGWLLGRIVDPFGHHWEIGTPLSMWPPAPGQAGAST